MSEIANASINTFGKASPKADFVPPSEQLITLTIGQLQDLVTQAVEKTIQPLQERVEALEVTVARQEEFHARQIAEDRKRITALEHTPKTSQGKRMRSRAEMLKALLKAKGGGMTFKEAGKALGIQPNQMTKLVESLDKRSFEVFTRSGDSRQRVIRLIAQNPFT